MTTISHNGSPDKPRRAAIYPRVSTGKQEEDGTSLVTQEERCRAHCAERSYIVDEAHIYPEVYTGAELWERPQLTRMREAIRRREVDVVVAYAIDRLSRDPVHLGVIISEAEHHGVAVEFVTEPLDDSPEGQLIRYVRGYAAKVEREKIRERSIRGKRARILGGKVHNYGVELYGYRRDKELGKRAIYEPEATIVRDVFAWLVRERLPIRAIVRRLNQEGVPSPSVGKVAYKQEGRRPHWGKGQVCRILTDPSYKGQPAAWRWKRGGKLRAEEEWVKLPADTTPAIVPAGLWDAARERLAANRGETTRNATRPHLLRGMVVCARCGRKMRPDRDGNYCAYRCSSRDTPDGPCGAKAVPAAGLERWAWAKIDAALRDPSVIAGEVERSRAKAAASPLIIDRETTERLLAKLEKQQEKLMRKYRESADDDEFPWGLVEREIGNIEKDKKGLRATLARLDEQLAAQQADVDQMAALNEYCLRVAAHLDSFDFAKKRLALESLDVRVTVDRESWHIDGRIDLENGACVVTQTYS